MKRKQSTTAFLLLFFGMFLLLSFTARSQNSDPKDPKRGAVNGTSYSISDIENINLTNGNLMLNVPLVTLPPTRGGLKASIGLTYNSKLYRREIVELLDHSNQMKDQNIIAPLDTGGWRLSSSLNYEFRVTNRFLTNEINCNDGDDYVKNGYRWRVQVRFPDGSDKEFIPVGATDYYDDGFYNISPNGVTLTYGHTYYPDIQSHVCSNTSGGTSNDMVYYTTDGSYIRMVVTHDSDNDDGNNAYTLYFADGSYFQSSNRRLTDRNGNYIEPTSFTYNGKSATGITDELGRKIFTTGGDTSGEGFVYQLGVGGEEIKWILRYTDTYVRKEYETTGAGSLRSKGGTSEQVWITHYDVLIDEVQLPSQYGNLKYEFGYDGSSTAPGSGQESPGWGQLNHIKMPSGAEVDYEYYIDDVNTDGVIGSSVSKKTLTYLAQYDGGSSNVEEVWNYNISPIGGSVTGPDGGTTTQSHGSTLYQDIYSGLVKSIEYPDGTKVEKIWGFVGTGSSGDNPYVKAEFKSIKSGGSYTLTAIKTFTQDRNGNTTSVKEYGFVPYGDVPRSGGFPTGLPGGIGNPVRATYTSYYNGTPDISDTSTSSSYNYWNYSAVKNVVNAVEVKNASNQTVSKTEFTYDDYSTTANRRMVRVWDSTKSTTITTPLTDSNSIKTETTYNSYGMPLTTTDANGNVTSITYGNVAGPNGNVTDLYPTQMVSASGTSVARTSSAVYDYYTGLTTSTTDEDNDVTNSTQYDDVGRPIKSISADGDATWEIWTVSEYHDADRFVVVKSDLETKGDGKKVATLFYDQLGRVRLSKTLEDAATQSASNETDGIKVQTRYATTYSSPNGFTYQLTSNPYRAATSSAATSEPTMGWTRSKSWHTGMKQEVETFIGAALPAPWASNTSTTGKMVTDIDANATTVTDQAGKLRRSITNGLGQLIRVDEPNSSNQLDTGGTPNQSTNYTYDTLNNLTGVSQGSQTRTFAYSTMSRLLSAVNPESGVISYVYDNNGNLTSKADARGIVTTYTYNAQNQITDRDFTGSTPDVDYTYGTTAPKVGKLTKVTNGTGMDRSTTEYTGFDVLGRVTSHKQTTDGEEYTTGYTYNLSGALIEETYPSGRVVKNTLDTGDGSLNQVQSKRSGDTYRNYANNFIYSAAGAVTAMRLGNGRWENATFNSRLQPTQIGLGNGVASQNLLKLEYSYGTTANNGNVVSQSITVPGVAYSFVQAYTYDSLNRITNAEETYNTSTQNWEQTFTYDRYGNRNFVEAETTTLLKNCMNGSTPIVCAADVPKVNPAVTASTNKFTTGYEYDSSGNITEDANEWTYVYDAENKQIEVKDDQDATVGQYWYDGDGKRIKKYVPDTGETTVFVYDAAGKQIAEYSTIIQDEEDAKVTYTTNDHLGSPRINTDYIGAVVARHDYHPFGEEIATAQRTTGVGYTADTIRKKFTGYERDGESGLDYAQARYYSSRHGRFSSPDEFEGSRDIGILGSSDPEKQALPYAQIVDPQTLNKYVYCRNNPLRFVDPDGHDWYESLLRMLSNIWNSIRGGPPATFGTERPLSKKQSGVIPGIPNEQTLAVQSWMTFGGGLDVFADVLENADPTGISGDARRLMEGDTSGLAVSGILRAGGPALSKLFGTSIRNLFSGRLLTGINEGTNVAAQFTKSAGTVTADIVYVGGAKQQGISSTIGALYKNVLKLAEQQGANKLVLNAVAVVNSKLAKKLERAGFTRTKVWVEGFGEVDAYTKTIVIPPK